jgi:hypothetical protein
VTINKVREGQSGFVANSGIEKRGCIILMSRAEAMQ